MSYRWQDCYCRECECMDMNDIWKYDNSKRYCSERHEYYNPNEQACSRMKYDESKKNGTSPCYLTTIIHNILGMPDNGFALQTLRNFRNNYMLNHPETYPMLIEYDIIGPQIAEALRNDPLNMSIAQTLYQTHIMPIAFLVSRKLNEMAIEKYQEMTNKLKNYYEIDDTITKKLDINVKTLGKSRA